MTWNWKLILSLGIVAILVVFVLFYQIGKRPQVVEEQRPEPIAEGPEEVVEEQRPEPIAERPEEVSGPVAEKPTPLPPATGNVDDAVNAVITATDNELAILNEYDSDVALVELDSQAISDIGQVYNENEF